MKKKTLITFDIQKQELWVKGLKSRKNASFILIARISESETFYAATIESGLSKRYKKNQQEMVEKIVLLKEKESKKIFLQVQLADGKPLNLKNEDYFLLIHVPNLETGEEDYVLVFNMPDLIEEGAHYQIFPSDAENENAIALFWLLKEFVPPEEGEAIA